MTIYSILLAVHLVGLALATGASVVKLVLPFRCNTDAGFVPVLHSVIRRLCLY